VDLGVRMYQILNQPKFLRGIRIESIQGRARS
jgi:hypothetical protein